MTSRAGASLRAETQWGDEPCDWEEGSNFGHSQCRSPGGKRMPWREEASHSLRKCCPPGQGGAGLVLPHGPSLSCSQDCTLEARDPQEQVGKGGHLPPPGPALSSAAARGFGLGHAHSPPLSASCSGGEPGHASCPGRRSKVSRQDCGEWGARGFRGLVGITEALRTGPGEGLEALYPHV